MSGKMTPSGTPIVEVAKDTLEDMLAQIKTLRAENKRLRLLLDPDAVDDFAALQRERDELRAEVEAWKERDAREHGELVRLRANNKWLAELVTRPAGASRRR